MPTTKSEDDAAAATAASVHDVQTAVDASNAQGFEGSPVDDTPRENYTLPGVVAGKPTPETTPLEKQ